MVSIKTFSVVLLFILLSSIYFWFSDQSVNKNRVENAIKQLSIDNNRAAKAIKKHTPLLKKAFAEQNLRWGSPIFIRLFKQEKELEVWVKSGERYQLFRRYPICYYGAGGLGPKLKEGDGMAPEGFYFVTAKQLNPHSNYHLAFNLGFPNRYDRAHGRTGSFLMVHGRCVSVGCYAMTDPLIEEIYTLAKTALDQGQPFFRVHIFPFHLSTDKLQAHADHPWFDFWSNLKQGYDWFVDTGLPHNVQVKNKRYVFTSNSQ